MYISQLNTSLQTKHCTATLAISASICRSRMITDTKRRAHAHMNTRRALLSDSTSEQIDVNASLHKTHAPGREQETTY